jgi:hypothetical protein
LPLTVPRILANGEGPAGPEKNLNLGWKSRITLRPLMVPVNGVLLDDTARSTCALLNVLLDGPARKCPNPGC